MNLATNRPKGVTKSGKRGASKQDTTSKSSTENSQTDPSKNTKNATEVEADRLTTQILSIYNNHGQEPSKENKLAASKIR